MKTGKGGGYLANGDQRLCIVAASESEEAAAAGLYRELQACMEEGRGGQLLEELADTAAGAGGGAGSYTAAWARHVLACHPTTLQCSANP